jgi:hypothetical protein
VGDLIIIIAIAWPTIGWFLSGRELDRSIENTNRAIEMVEELLEQRNALRDQLAAVTTETDR